MAKGTAMGVWRGKKGSSVFYYLRNSKNAQKQGIRERVYEINNPQTNGQTDQRMKMLPLQRMGATLGTIVRRSWEGVEYGGKTWQKFLSANMGSNSTLPFIDKDDDRTIPGDIQVSKGTLEPIGGTFDDDLYITDLKLGNFTSAGANIGTYSTALIDNNPELQEGDQLTFIVCSTDAQGSDAVLDAHYYWSVVSIILAKASTAAIPSLNNAKIDSVASLTVLDSYDLALKTDNVGNFVCAAAVIHSRLGDNNKYLRSTQRLGLSNVIDAWFSSARHSAARRSYKRSTAAASTNWPVDPDAAIEGTVPGSYTISGLTGDKASCNGKSCWVRRYEDTNELAAVYITEWLGSPSTALVNRTNGHAISYAYQSTEVPLLVAEVTALANLPQIQWDGEPTS